MSTIYSRGIILEAHPILNFSESTFVLLLFVAVRYFELIQTNFKKRNDGNSK